MGRLKRIRKFCGRLLLLPLLARPGWTDGSAFQDGVAALSQQIVAASPKPTRLLISNIYDKDGRLTYLGRYLSEKLQASLTGKPGIVLVARQRLDLILDEIRLQQTGLMDPHSVVKAGKLLGAETIVYGTVTDLEKAIDIDLTIQSIESGVLIGTASQRFKKTADLASLLRSIIDSERKQNEEDLSFARRPGVEDKTKIRALEDDSKKLGEALKTGVWRGGPTFESVAAGFLTRLASDEPASPKGLWLRGGAILGAMHNHPSLGLSYHITRSFGLELDGGMFKQYWASDPIQDLGGGSFGAGQIRRNEYFSYAKVKTTYSATLQSIPLVADSRIRFPLTLTIGAGVAYTHIRETRTDRTWVAYNSLVYDDKDATFNRVEPVAGVSLTHYIKNFIGVRIGAEKIFSNKQNVGPYSYATLWWSISLGYRLL